MKTRQRSLFPTLPDEIEEVKETLGAEKVRFDGSDYKPAVDDVRLAGQILRIFNCMSDGQWRTLGEVAFATRTPEASVSAQLRHLRKKRFGGHTVNKRHVGAEETGLWEYQLIVKK